MDDETLAFASRGGRPPVPGTLELLSVMPVELAGTVVPQVRWRLGLDRGRFNAWVPLNDSDPDRLVQVHELPAGPVLDRLRRG